MTKTTRTWLLLIAIAAIAAIALFVWWPKRDAPVPVQATSNPTPVQPARPTAPSRTVAYTVSDIDRDAIAQDLRIVDRIARMQKQRGKDDLVFDHLQMIAIQSCGVYRGVASQNPEVHAARPELALSAVRRDPTRAWAFEYLEQACEGLDVDALFRDYNLLMPDWTVAYRDKDETTAIALALDDLRRSESDAALLMGLRYLERQGKSPLPTTYRSRDEVTNLNIVSLATNPITCRALDMCGSQNAEIAGVCLLEGCPRGTTMEQFIRNKLTPKQFEAAMKLRADLARYRASPMRR